MLTPDKRCHVVGDHISSIFHKDFTRFFPLGIYIQEDNIESHCWLVSLLLNESAVLLELYIALSEQLVEPHCIRENIHLQNESQWKKIFQQLTKLPIPIRYVGVT